MESVEETENENNQENDQQDYSDDEPVNNEDPTEDDEDTDDDDVQEKTDEESGEDDDYESAPGGGSVSQAEANVNEDDTESNELNKDAEQAEADGEEVEVNLDKEEKIATESHELCTEMNTVLGVAVALESVSEFMYASMKNGSYNPIASTFVNTQVNLQLERLNQRTGSLIAMEADADPAAQAGVATQNRGTIRQFIDRMIQACKNALDTVIDFVKKRTEHIFTATGRMKTRATALLKHLEAKETVMRPINSQRTALAIGVNGVVGDLNSQLTAATEYINHFCSEAAYGHFKNMIKNAVGKEGSSVMEMTKSYSLLSEAWIKKLKEKHIKEENWYSSELLPGNIVFSACLPPSIEKLQDLKTQVRVIETTGTVNPEIAAMDIAAAKTLVSKIIKGVETIEKTRNSPAIKEVEKGFSDLVRETKRLDEKANSGIIRQGLSAVVRLITASASAPSVTFTSGWLRISANILNYLSSSSSFGFVNAASNAAGDKLAAGSDAIGRATKPTRDAISRTTKPYTDKLDAATKPARDAIGSKYDTAKAGVNSKIDSAKSGVDNLRNRFNKA